MFKFQKQKDKWNQILRERKYRPSFLGLSVHTDWHFLLFFTFFCLILISAFAFVMNVKISNLLEKDFYDEINANKSSDVDINHFEKIIKRVESN